MIEHWSMKVKSHFGGVSRMCSYYVWNFCVQGQNAKSAVSVVSSGEWIGQKRGDFCLKVPRVTIKHTWHKHGREIPHDMYNIQDIPIKYVHLQ